MSDTANQPGPGEINQTSTVATGYGYASRCGCGWRALHPTQDQGHASCQQHAQTHTGETG